MLEEEGVAAAKSNALQIFRAAALALPGVTPEIQAAQPAEKPALDFQYARYQESSDRITVDVYQGSAVLPIEQTAEISVNWTVDTFSGATPVLTMPESAALVVSGASGINGVNANQQVAVDARPIQVMTGASTRETRYGIDLGGSYYFDNITLHASGSRSEEPDYLSHAYSLGMDWELNQKLTTLSVSFGQNFDQVEPSTRTLQETRTDHHFQLGISQVLDKKSLLNLSFTYSINTGYLSNPYKKVYIQNLPAGSGLDSGGFDNVYYENRPEQRHVGAATLSYTHYFSDWDSALHLDYRYYRDSWNIDSHTLEAAWHQPFSDGWMLIPNVRYYTQSKARFYELFFAAPQADNHYSSDYRLAGFGSIGTGIKLSKEILQKTGFISSMKFQAGFEFTFHAADLKLGDQQGSELTDFNYFLATASFKIEF